MWWLQHLSILQIKDGYVTYSGMWELRQQFECPLVPGIYTLSIKAANCNGKTVFRCVSGQNESIVEFIIPEIGAEWEFKKITFCAEKSISYISFYNVGQEDATMDIQAVKLEVGPISTLALDLMQPSDYAAELRKCQRYLQVIKLYGRAPFVYTAGKARNVVKYDQVQLRPNMRIAPSIAKIISNKFFSEKNNSWMHDGTLTLNNSCVSEVNVYNNYYSILGDDNVLDTELIFLLSAEL